MSNELSGLFKAAARDEAAEAGREFPLSPTTLDRFVGHVRRRRAARAAALAVGSAVVVGAAVFGFAQVWHVGPIAPGVTPSPSSSPSPSASPSPSTSPSIEPSPSPTATTTTPPPPPPAVPGRVTEVSVWPGATGAIQVEWGMIANATGYRVYRSASPDGPFTRSASALFDVDTGKVTTTIEIGVPYEKIWIGFYSSGTLTYGEIVDRQPACFRVAAFNSKGEGPRSAVVCGDPTPPEPSPDPSTPAPDPSTPSP